MDETRVLEDSERYAVWHNDCLVSMATMPENSIDAIVTDPPYGLEFMGKDWDSFKGEAWRSGAGMSKPGIGDRKTAWPSFGAGDTANATCERCKGRMRGKKKCACEEPIWRVKGSAVNKSDANQSRAMSFYAFNLNWATEALRVAKPGAHLLAFGGTRMFHRLACALEDAGWELRDTIMWVYGSGFPKSLDVSKAIDKEAGAKREVTGRKLRPDGSTRETEGGRQSTPFVAHATHGDAFSTAPTTEEAKQWEGWGTALKPSWEPILVARKPLHGTVAENVLAYGTGALNIDDCRVTTEDNLNGGTYSGGKRRKMPGDERSSIAAGRYGEDGRCSPEEFRQPQGRWPANLIHDGSQEVLALFPTTEQPNFRNSRTGKHKSGWGLKDNGEPFGFNDDGNAARFFYCAKASNEGRGNQVKAALPLFGVAEESVHNPHPTVKPVELMRYLCRLVTPPNGIILDLFMGSGSTGVAALQEGFRFIGVEQNAEYVEFARARIKGA